MQTIHVVGGPRDGDDLPNRDNDTELCASTRYPGLVHVYDRYFTPDGWRLIYAGWAYRPDLIDQINAALAAEDSI